MAHVPSGYAHGHNVQFSYLFSGFILRVFNSNVTTEFCTTTLFCITKYWETKYIVSLLVQKSKVEGTCPH